MRIVLQLLLVIVLPLLLSILLQRVGNDICGYASRIIGGGTAWKYLMAPGVLIHELGHAVGCWLMGERVVKIELYPKNDPSVLGRIWHKPYPGLFAHIRGFVISFGPVWFGTILIAILMRFCLLSSPIHFVLGLYFIICIAANMSLSGKDLKNGRKGMIQIIVVMISMSAALNLFSSVGSKVSNLLVCWLMPAYGVIMMVVAGEFALSCGLRLIGDLIVRHRIRTGVQK